MTIELHLRLLYMSSAVVRFVRTLLTEHLLPPRTLVIVHVGKCGGRSLKKAVARSLRMAWKFSEIYVWHTNERKFPAGDEYIVVLRSPIRRAISAFNFRWAQVVADKSDSRVFPGEQEALTRWGGLNALAEALYSEQRETANFAAARAFESVHHLGDESIHQFIDALSDETLKEKPVTCLVTETMAQDAKRNLRLRVGHNHPGRHHRHLSNTAEANLRRFLTLDFQAIKRLYRFGLLTQEQFDQCWRYP